MSFDAQKELAGIDEEIKDFQFLEETNFPVPTQQMRQHMREVFDAVYHEHYDKVGYPIFKDS